MSKYSGHWIRFNRKTGDWFPVDDDTPGGLTNLTPEEEVIRVNMGDKIQYETKDSGAREVMPTGSQRDTREGKGRFDLITPFAMARLAGVYERGAVKYDARNWEKGQPFSRLFDSATRHLNRFAMGWTDEDHLAQALWNIAAIIHFQELIARGIGDFAALDDMPKYEKGPKDDA